MNSLANMPSNWQCHKKLFKIVWGVDCCPNCGGKLLFRPSYEWCKQCRSKTSVKSETWFRNSKLSFRQIWLITWCWQNKQSIGSTRRLCGISYPTVGKWFNKLRKALAQLPQPTDKLSGVVEIDESFFGKRCFGEQKIVVGAIESDTGRIRLQIIPNRERDTLESFVLDNVEGGSHILTDALPSYNELKWIGYTHDFCNHSIGHFGLTNHIENLWGVIKRHLRYLYGHLTLPDLNLILREWEIRRNRPDIMYNVTNYLRVTVCSGLLE